jgi:NAD(P)-dependent dehydrogenase (short-subunit alcohol dehydrogenase family)
MKKEMQTNVSLGRLGDSDEVTKVVAFLASDESSYSFGVKLFVDGGVAQI